MHLLSFVTLKDKPHTKTIYLMYGCIIPCFYCFVSYFYPFPFNFLKIFLYVTKIGQSYNCPVFSRFLLTTNFKKFLFQFIFHILHLNFCCSSLSSSFCLNLHNFIQCRNQGSICIFQCLHIHDAAF